LQDKTGRSALHWAAESNQLEAAKTLIDFGINLLAMDSMGRSVT
jgi:ankyrin repeat protein